MRPVSALTILALVGVAIALFLQPMLSAQADATVAVPLDGKLKAINVLTSWGAFKGSPALEVRRPLNLQRNGIVQSIVILPTRGFRNGTIELDLEGHVGKGADPTARGFVGMAFHLSSDAQAFDAFYVRPTNGRADDQLRRNHALQYVSMPSYDFQRLRTESPGVYESYADIQPDRWINIKIQVAGTRAKLYVNGATQPSLIVNDLKRAEMEGAVALWTGPGTVAHFKNIRVNFG